MCVAELDLRESVGGSNVTGSGTASASSIYSGSYDGAKAFDGNPATNLSTADNYYTNQWLAYDFGSGNDKDINEFALTVINYSANHPMNFALQHSDDGATWETKFLVFDQISWTAASTRTYNSSNSLAFASVAARRYWRVRCMPGTENENLGIQELELRESVGGVDATGSGTASASTYVSTHAPANAFDGNGSTSWYSAVGQANWIQYDFGEGATKAIAEWAITCGSTTAVPLLSVLQMSADGTTWENVAHSELQTGWSLTETRAFSVPSSGVSSLEASAGLFESTGQSASILASRKLFAASGSFALSGQSASVLAGRTLSASSGSFVLAGEGANLLASRMLSASAGEFDLTGQDATLTYTVDKILHAEVGQFSASGHGANLVVSRTLPLANGEFTLTGKDASLEYGQGVLLESGEFVLTGQDISFSRDYVLDADTGYFDLDGFPIGGAMKAILCSKSMKSIIFDEIGLQSEILAAIAEPSIIKKEFIFNARDICW